MKITTILWKIFRIVAVVFIAVHATLYFAQRRLVYHPRPYSSPNYLKDSEALRPHVLEYSIEAGKQLAYYIPPANAVDPTEKPKTLWVCFGGNGSRAMGWKNTIEEINVPDYAYLLIEYPGYGANEGSPNIEAIRKSSQKAYATLCDYLKIKTDDPDVQLNILGHSLGTATGLQFADSHPVANIVLAAPFSSIADMATRSYGPTVTYLLTERFDNINILQNLLRRDKRPAVYIVHGVNDNIIPVSMAQTMAKEFSEIITYKESPTADHINITNDAAAIIRKLHAAKSVSPAVSKQDEQTTTVENEKTHTN